MNEKTAWHSLNPREVLEALKSTEDGLTSNEAVSRRRQYGPNIIPEPPLRSLLVVFIDQFKNAFIYLLLLATLVSIFMGEIGDSLFIALVLVLNAIIGTTQEWQAQVKAQGLKNLIKSMVTARRDRLWKMIDGRDVVPGDIIAVEAGSRVTAEMRLLSNEGLEVDESLLTGESEPVVKDADASLQANTVLADRVNMLHAGATILRGRGIAVVTATGPRTEVGQVAEALKGLAEIKPPLIRRMQRFTQIVAGLMAGVITLIALAEVLRGTDLTVILMTSVALAVAVIPEGLPVALTVTLAISVARMAKRDVVVGRMAAVEGLGACSLIATDKTGTLTINELTVQRVWLPAFGELSIDDGGQAGDTSGTGDLLDAYQQLVLTGVLCNESSLNQNADGTFSLIGDTVDGAFLKLGKKCGMDQKEIDLANPRCGRIAYEPSLAFAASFHQQADSLQARVKGAAEVVLSFCGGDLKQEVTTQVNRLAGQGYRVIALAQGKVAGMAPSQLQNLSFLGLVALIDPLRPSAKETIRRCRDAGVAVHMITGDHPMTALEIGRQLDMADSEEDVVTGRQLAELEADQDAFDAVVARAQIFARIAPLQKLSIVQAMQRRGNIVAVTGDGVNDAAALAAADIGAAMGKSGTDIARSASDLILVNDDLSALADGIEEGRIAYDNIRKVIYLLISMAIAELVLFVAAIATGLPLPLTPVQLLWLNLVTEGIQGVALAFEKGEPDVLKRRPRPVHEGIFNRQMIEQTLLSGLLVGSVAFLLFRSNLAMGMSPVIASNQLLLLLILFENAHIFNCRSELHSAFSTPLRNNVFLVGGVLVLQLLHLTAMHIPGLNTVLDIQPVSLVTWLELALPVLSIILLMEFYKLLKRYSQRRSHL